MKIRLCFVLIVLPLCACNGVVKSRMWTQDQLIKAASTKDGINGVLGYYQRPVLEVDEMTLLVDKDGKFVSAICRHVLVQKIISITDYDHPVEIWYDPGLLEANKFSVQLNNSVFTAVNSESTQTRGRPC